ncbi:Ankyrin repeat protein 1 [Giardia muris]|uniref:Ankyrin repeat protein 1 n=1 Tax=Giardia muris TaxID=5742 RepID=A0A4Z1T299_GIAMU|nr:Ankyrin repeat protein 1 [Giardia muris]|eukprot:TNJ27157.1 Ankyrin repeat protein 1 [Giardia muris]
MPILDKKDWFQAIANRNHAALRTVVPKFAGSKNGAGDTGLIMAARLNDLELAHMLARQEGTLINADNLTALMIAAQVDHPRIVEVLAPIEAKVILPNGRTALSIAAEQGHDECVLALIKYLSTERDSDGLSALDYAVKNSHVVAARLLLNTHKFTIDDLTQALQYAHDADAGDIIALLETEAERLSAAYLATGTTNRQIAEGSPLVGSRLGGTVRSPMQGGVQSQASVRMRTVGMTESMRSGGRAVTRFSDIQAYEKELDSALEKLDKLEVECTVLKTENQRIFEENVKVRAENKAMREELDQVAILIQNGTDNFVGLASAARAYIAKISADKDRCQREFDQLKQDVEILQAKNDAFKTDLNTLMSTKVEHEKAVSYLRQNIVSKDEVLNTLQQQNLEVIEQAKMLENRAADFSIEIAKLTDNAARQRQESIGLRSIIEQKDREIEEVKAQVEDVNELVNTYRQRAMVMEGEKNEILNEVNRRKAAMVELEAKKDELETQVVELADELTKSSLALQTLQQGISNLEDPFAIATTGDFVNFADETEGSVARKIMTGDKSAMIRQMTETEVASYDQASSKRRQECEAMMRQTEEEWLADPLMQQLRRAILKGDLDLTADISKRLNMDFASLRSETGPKTRLMAAAEDGSILKVWFYRDYQACRQDPSGKTALMYAAENGHTECVRMLLAKEGGMTLDTGFTALMFAVQGNYPECVELLEATEAGMTTNERYEEGAGFTALMLAAKLGHVNCVHFLLSKEASLKNSNGRRAVFYAKTTELKNLLSLFQ